MFNPTDYQKAGTKCPAVEYTKRNRVTGTTYGGERTLTDQVSLVTLQIERILSRNIGARTIKC